MEIGRRRREKVGRKEGKLEKQSQREREREAAADRAPRPSAINDSWLPPLQGFAIGCGGAAAAAAAKGVREELNSSLSLWKFQKREMEKSLLSIGQRRMRREDQS